jgi:hypothetical protein
MLFSLVNEYKNKGKVRLKKPISSPLTGLYIEFVSKSSTEVKAFVTKNKIPA